MNSNTCPICDYWLESEPEAYAPNGGSVGKVYDCLYCSKFAISDELDADRDQFFNGTKEQASIIRFKLAARSLDKLCFLTTENISTYKTGNVPKPIDQMNNLIIWLGNTMGSNAGDDIIMKSPDIIRHLGSPNDEGFNFVLKEAEKRRYISYQGLSIVGGTYKCQGKLTLKGWDYFDELQIGKLNTRQAFMAMQFGNNELDEIVENIFKPAVLNTGFELKRLDDSNPAGLIDDRLRVEIRKSRFLIADLSHGNKGAYWEAGFAEGLGKEVIYTCKKEVFDDEKNKPHFDTNHHLTIVWDPRNLTKAGEQIKACIRATFPEDAELEDGHH